MWSQADLQASWATSGCKSTCTLKYHTRCTTMYRRTPVPVDSASVFQLSAAYCGPKKIWKKVHKLQNATASGSSEQASLTYIRCCVCSF
jgi:hypothetical protein